MRFLKFAVFISTVAVLTATANAQSFNVDTTPLSFSPTPGGQSVQATVTVFNLTANPLNLSVMTSGGSWLSAFLSPNPVPGNGSSTLTVTVNPANLVGGVTVNGTVTVSGGGTTATINVSVTPAGVSISVPSFLSVNVLAGQQTSVSVHVSGGPATVLIGTSTSWLSPDSQVSAPGNFSVTVNASSLGPGSHSGSLSLQCAQGSSPCLPVAISVTANVTQPVTLTTNISSLTFQAYQGRPNPGSQALQLRSSDGSSLGFTLSPNQSWLTATASSSTASSAPAVVTISVNGSALNPGTNSGTVSVQPANGGPTLPITVTATLSAFTISVSPNPVPQLMVAEGLTQGVPFQVASADGGPVTVGIAVQTDQGSNWLQAPTTLDAPASFNVTLNAVGLNPSSYTGSVTVTCTNATCAPVKVPVAVTVTEGKGPQITSGGVISASNFGAFPSITSGSYMEIYGANLSTTTNGWASGDFHGNQAPTKLDGVSATINGKSAFVNYVSPGQVNLVAPDDIGTGSAQLILTNSEGATTPYSVQVNTTQPGMLAPPAFLVGGKQYVVAQFSDGTYVLPSGAISGLNSRPAKPGETIVIYGIGFGPVTPNSPAGEIVAGQNQLALAFHVTFGQTPADLQYDGLSPNFVGLYQFNIVVPMVANSDAVPLAFNLDGTPGSQALYTAVHN